ncbi:PREDICTED: transcription factor SPT20 homolog [Papilio polytes]|uniref:transcription factor SPT20 homolog n=1 Tax=Papilio polytes TaxID=76194 RepID=UPI000675F422|nr:PREDICTED: transcription factor SPT20 homolog [Papilio polytes]
MDGLIHAALEAEVILNRVKHANANLTQFDSGVPDHKMTWTHEKIHLAETVDDSRMKFQRNSTTLSTSKSSEKFDLFKKLHELYNELSRDEASQINYQGLKITSYLLEKLLATYNLNTLIINLYPGNKGYSLSLKVNGNTQYIQPPDANISNQEETLIETPRWPYEEEELLSYIDNEELPVVLLDLLESEHSSLFYSGCIIAQIRDYRQAYPSFLCDTHHVLLRPTNQSIITDAMCIGGKCGWSGEERGALDAVEAALVHAADPRPAVGLLAARLHAAPRLFNTPRIRRQARRFSQVAVNRKRKLDQFTHYHGLELLELIHRQRAKNRQTVPLTRLTSKYPKKPPEVFKPIEAPKMDPVPLVLPAEASAPLRLARAYERPRPTSDCQPQLVEEYVLETEKTSPHASAGFFHIKLSILQRPSDQEFLGELYVDRDHVEGERNGSACRFTLGTRLQANKYIQQFTEIFTEEGRKSVRIKHIVPGQLPRVSYTGSMREMGQQLLLQQRAAAVNNSTVQTHSTTVPVVTSAVAPTPNAQLQQVGNVGGVATVSTVVGNIATVGNVGVGGVPAGSVGVVNNVGNVAAAAVVANEVTLKQQPSPTTPRLSPQVLDIHSSQASTNQLLAQQLTNPPQPLNPQKMQSAIIHIQHPLMSSAGTSQVQNIQYTNTSTTQQKATVSKPRTTNPAISALVTSLMNSAQQFQQAASQNAAKAVVSTANSNATILNLLNSAPAAMTHATQGAHVAQSAQMVQSSQMAQTSQMAQSAHLTQAAPTDGAIDAHKLLGRTVSISGARLIATTTASHSLPTYTQQVMSGYTCDSESTNVSSSESALLERLMGPDPTPATQAQPVCHLQGLSLTSLQGLQGIQGLQNVQVQIPGLPAPISLSLNVSGAPSGLLVSVPPTTSVVLTNQPSVLSLPIAQLMSAGGVKGAVRGGSVQVVRSARGTRLARPAPAPAPSPAPSAAQPPPPPPLTATRPTQPSQGTAQYITQTQTQALNPHQVRRKSNPDSS